MAATTSDLLYDTAATLTDGSGPSGEAAVRQLVDAAGGDRLALETARNRYAHRLHGHSDDWQATAALTLLNRALTEVAAPDPYDWKQRWARGRKP